MRLRRIRHHAPEFIDRAAEALAVLLRELGRLRRDEAPKIAAASVSDRPIILALLIMTRRPAPIRGGF